MLTTILARGTRRAAFALLALVALSGCPSGAADDGGADAARDTNTAVDAPGADRGVDAPAADVGADAPVADQGVDAPLADRPGDSAPPDTTAPADAIADAPRDATTPVDAATDSTTPGPDAVTACGTLGAECRDMGACSAGEDCYASGRGGVCAVARPICGGFAGAMCPTDAPHCLTLAGTDFGACATDSERDCICASAGATTITSGCR